jgi:hypothetical protein
VVLELAPPLSEFVLLAVLLGLSSEALEPVQDFGAAAGAVEVFLDRLVLQVLRDPQVLAAQRVEPVVRWNLAGLPKRPWQLVQKRLVQK